MSGRAHHPDRRDVLAVTASAGAAALLGDTAVGAAPAASHGVPADMRMAFDAGWRFHLGDAGGAEAAAYDDGGWRTLDLPHDWSIEDLAAPAGSKGIIGPFDRHAIGGTATGFTVGGTGWYRKRFRLTAPPGGRAEILFDGVYMNSEVWLNGHRLGEHPYGYTPFAYDLTPYLASDGDNVIAVRVRNEGRNSRWYSGSGIYRHVWLEVRPDRARVARWGVAVSTRSITAAGAVLAIDIALESGGADLVATSRICDRQGRTVWQTSGPAGATLSYSPRLRAPHLWSPDSPTLYTLVTELRRGPTLLDRAVTPFGIRVVTFDAARGMTVNGKATKLRGGCIHHDNGLLGACAFDAAEERKVVLLKARGYNAVRPSHNPFSPAFLDACDRHGMLVVAETFDCWRQAKTPQDYAIFFDAQWRADLRTIVRSARHHPSIVMWSIGNEIPGRNSADGLRLQWELANEVHGLDPSRPVTAAINSFPGRPIVVPGAAARPGRGGKTDYLSNAFLDVIGYNYKLADYEADHIRFPERVFFGTESFPKDIFTIWALTDRSPWLIGDFVWTAMDYLGEAGIGGTGYVPIASKASNGGLGAWSSVNANCGDIDLIGQQKGASLARDVVWGVSALEIAVQRPVPEGKREVLRIWGWSDEWPSWTWPGADGKPLKLRVYTAGDHVVVMLNGKPAGERRLATADLRHAEFDVPYAPGTLDVVAYRDGKPIGRRRLVTAGAPVAIRLTPERPAGGCGRGDVSFVLAEIVDAGGRLVPDARLDLDARIEGPGELAGFGSADPTAVGSYQRSSARSWAGRALLIVRGAGSPGTVRIAARGAGLRDGHTTIALS